MPRNRMKKKKVWTTTSAKVLVLNGSFVPVDVCTWEEAIIDWAGGRAEIHAQYDDIELHSGKNKMGATSVVMKCPSIVIKLDAKPRESDYIKTLPFTRKNILDRDHSMCAYCGCSLSLNTMTIDHVYPVSKGGLNDWANVRAACTDCNSKKGNQTLSELGWKLRRRVGIPTLSKHAPKSVIAKIGGKIPHEEWRKYIYWQVDTKEKIRDI